VILANLTPRFFPFILSHKLKYISVKAEGHIDIIE